MSEDRYCTLFDLAADCLLILDLDRIIELDGDKVMFSVIRDISGRRTAEQKIAQLAYFDVLTNLPNRTLFYDRLDQAVARARRYQQKFAVMFLDLDGFKRVKDEFGHHAGNCLLSRL